MSCSTNPQDDEAKITNQLKTFCLENTKDYLSENELPEYCNCAINRIKDRKISIREIELMLSDNNLHTRLKEVLGIEISECVQDKMLSGIQNLSQKQKGKFISESTQWTAENEKKFILASKKMIPKNVLSKIDIKSYCDCMKTKAVMRFPHFDSIQHLLKNRRFDIEFESDKEYCIVNSILKK